MRKNMEEIIGLQKEMEQRIGNFLKDELVQDYQVFWRDFKRKSNENTQALAKFMVRKCNR